MLANEPLFKSADAYQDDVLALPVHDLESSTKYYVSSFGMSEVDRPVKEELLMPNNDDGVRAIRSVDYIRERRLRNLQAFIAASDRTVNP